MESETVLRGHRKRHKLQIFYELLITILDAVDDNATLVKPMKVVLLLVGIFGP